MHVADANFYPRAFLSMKVTAYDDTTGKPANNEFYKDDNFTVLQFSWIQTYNANEELETWKVTFPA